MELHDGAITLNTDLKETNINNNEIELPNANKDNSVILPYTL